MNSQEVLDLFITEVKERLKDGIKQVDYYSNRDVNHLEFWSGYVFALSLVEDLTFNLKNQIWVNTEAGIKLVKD